MENLQFETLMISKELSMFNIPFSRGTAQHVGENKTHTIYSYQRTERSIQQSITVLLCAKTKKHCGKILSHGPPPPNDSRTQRSNVGQQRRV